MILCGKENVDFKGLLNTLYFQAYMLQSHLVLLIFRGAPNCECGTVAMSVKRCS